jgi:hypothetical protein
VCVCSGGGGLHTDSLFFIGYINEITALNYWISCNKLIVFKLMTPVTQ